MVKKKARKPAKKKKPVARPRKVDYHTIKSGRRNQQGRLVDLYARVETRDGVTSVSMGSAFDKLQIRVTEKALADLLKAMA